MSPAHSLLSLGGGASCEGVPSAVRATAQDARGCPVLSGGTLAFTVSARGPAAYVDIPMAHVGHGLHEVYPTS